MRTIAKKISHLRHHIRRPKRSTHFSLLNGGIGKLYKNSVRKIKQRPYTSLGTAVAVSAVSGLLIWFLRK